MKPKRKFASSVVIPIFISLSAIVLIIAVYFLQNILFDKDVGMFLIVFDLLLTGFIFAYFQYRFHRKWKVNVRNIIKIIDAIRNGEVIERTGNTISSDGVLNEILDNMEIDDIYESLMMLSKSLRKMEKTRSDLLNMINSAASNMELEKLLESLIPKLAESLNSSWGAFYLANNATNKLEIKSSIGFSKNIYAEFDISIGEGFIGAVALTGETKIISDIPDDTVYITKTFLGRIKPKNLMLVPIINQDQLMGVLALGSVYEYSNDQMELVNLIKYYIGAAVGNGVIYERSKRLTNELKFQNKLIQDLNKELEAKFDERNLFLNTIINSIRDYAIYALDKEGTILMWNAGAEVMFGYSTSEVVGKNISIIYSVDDIESGVIKKRIDNAYKFGKYTEKSWRRRRDGTIYYVDMVIFAMYNQNGEAIGFTNVTKDITAIKTAQDDLMFEKALSKHLFENSDHPSIIINHSFIIEVANKCAQDFFSNKDLITKDLKDLKGMNLFDLFEETQALSDYIDNYTDKFEQVVKIQMKCKDTKEVIFASVLKIDDDTGRFGKIVLIFEII